ncbi:MAG: ricin-type beta-trefoil lectin domain protein, partial [Streptomyces sp.]|nr:ricin-type beta-trefoil lectin domain protein [Streptomyces sp.]NUS77370.1 ricin-type beta-trefoil lectin domain protein [Streptomyces sp.]
PSRSRLRNVGADLCLDIRGEVKKGAGTELEACSDDDTQKWTYDEEDGLLRSAADPDLCLDSRADAGVVILGSCADEKSKRAADVRYDITVQGELLTRWDDQLAVTSTSGEPDSDIVVKVRDGSDQQRWVTDAVSPSAGALSVPDSDAPSVRAVDLTERGAPR